MIQDLIMLFKIPMGTRRNLCKIYGPIRANIRRAEAQCCCLPRGLFPLGLATNTLYRRLLCATRATRHAQLLLLDLMRCAKQGAGMGDRRGAYKLFRKQTRTAKNIFSQPTIMHCTSVSTNALPIVMYVRVCVCVCMYV